MQTRRNLIQRFLILLGTGPLVILGGGWRPWRKRPTPDTLEYGQMWAHPDGRRRIIMFRSFAAGSVAADVYSRHTYRNNSQWCTSHVATWLAEGWQYIGIVWDR